ncbi:MAG TPA: NAD(P)-binding domain-containing protein [Hyphomicrobiaceae bacterium]|nr:NAD(P)-binding domain-containing protein [Hyphomicrobiaceae bacterium]
MPSAKTIAIIGAGPVGLAAAAHALERGLEPRVLEAGPAAGQAVREWSHVRMFSPWRYNVDSASERLLQRMGWTGPDPERHPTGAELLERYLEPLATRTALRDRITTNARVTSIARAGFDKVTSQGREHAPFEIRYRNGNGDGEGVVHAEAVIDASGTWSIPRPAGANGLEAIGEADHHDRIAYRMPDVLGSARPRYAGKTVAVLGAGHSAIGTIIDLKQLQHEHPDTRIIWLLRSENPEKSFGGGANDQLAARGELGQAFARIVRAGGIQVETRFRLGRISRSNDKRLKLAAGLEAPSRHVLADELIVATGFRPDLSFLRELRITLDPALECPPALAPLIDPNLHSCGTVRPHGAAELAQPEPGFYIAGMKSYGRAPTFLMMTGYEQVRSIVAEIAGDREAARRVELVLPETGVCSGSTGGQQSIACCGGPPTVDASACCKADESAKAAGRAGCGCA